MLLLFLLSTFFASCLAQIEMSEDPDLKPLTNFNTTQVLKILYFNEIIILTFVIFNFYIQQLH